MAPQEKLPRTQAVCTAAASGVVVFAVLTVALLVIRAALGPSGQGTPVAGVPTKPEAPVPLWESAPPTPPGDSAASPRRRPRAKPHPKRLRPKRPKPGHPPPTSSDSAPSRRVVPSSKFIDGEIVPFDPKLLEPTEEDLRAHAAAEAAQRAAAEAAAAGETSERPHHRPPKHHPESVGRFKILSKSGGTARNQSMSGFRDGAWHNGDQLWWTGAKVGDRLEIALPVEKSGRYKVGVVLTKAPDYGIVLLRLDGKKTGPPIDLYHTTVTNSPPIPLGKHQLSQGKHTLGVEIVGANEKSRKRYYFGLDRVLLKPAE